MNNNDVLRSLRFSLELSDDEIARLVGLGGKSLRTEDVLPRLTREGEPGMVPCSSAVLGAFLDGLIRDRRGPPDPSRRPPAPVPLNNNEILKKVRIALELREEQMLKIAEVGGQKLSRSELAALFRKPNHRHFRPCGNQLLRRFMRGLVKTRRPTA